MKLKKGDQIKVLSGKEKGKKGKIIRVYPEDNKVLVEGLNLHKKHARSRQQDKKGEVILVPGSIRISNVQLVCPHCAKSVRVGYEISDNGKFRVCKKCHQAI